MAKIWVDADALPRAAREILVRASVKREIEIVFVKNGWMDQPKSPRVEVVLVSQGPDVADDHIADEIESGDLCITADIPLAARVVEKGARVITPHGKELDETGIGEALSLRNFYTDLREQGVQTGGPAPYDDKVKQQFANSLDRWITKHG